MGGKSAVEIAEERLRQDQSSYGGYGGGGGYQGISIPTNDKPSYGGGSSSQSYGGGSSSLKIQSKGQWGAKEREEPAPPKKETNNLFGSMKVNDGKKRMDDDSDYDDDQPV